MDRITDERDSLDRRRIKRRKIDRGIMPMHTLRAEFEVVETQERFFMDGLGLGEMIDRARVKAGEWATVTVRTIAVLAVLTVCFKVGDVTYCFDEPKSIANIETAGQTSAPQCVEYCGVRS